MNILLTGGTGYIGSHTAVRLAEQGHNIVLFDNLCNSQRNVVDKIGRITGRKISFVEGDIRDPNGLIQALDKFQIQAIMHFAGLKSVAESVQLPLKYFETNISGSINLLNCMNQANVRNLIFSSSATVYGNPAYLPYDEDHPTTPTTTYGQTKLHVEQLLQQLCASDERWNVCSLRYFNPVGAHKSGLIGDSPNGLPNNLMPYLTRVASGTLDKLTIFGSDYDTPDGTPIRDYIHIIDLADGHISALNYINRHSGYHTFNLGTGQGFSVLEMINTFSKSTGINIKYELGQRRSGDLPSYFANAQKASQQLLWSSKHSLHEMCVDSLNFETKISSENDQ